MTSRLKMRMQFGLQSSEGIFLCELAKMCQFLMLMRQQSKADEKLTRWNICTSIIVVVATRNKNLGYFWIFAQFFIYFEGHRSE